ncbi:PD-(D/E)XK nuclease family protein [Candidatus Woesearchaeota archaeon]|nr:PD-(D/E)XK nuclease family protein [Candidatus Woesearchaeota archaeon]
MTKYSHSKLGTFLQCKYKYKLQYIDKIKADLETIEPFMGKRVHETLEKLYKDLKFQKVNSKEELLVFFNIAWNKNWHEDIVINKEYTAENYREMGKKFISDYYDHYKPFNHLTTLGLETQDFLPLDENTQFHVRIDRLACDKEGNYYVCDYKTNSSLKVQEDLDEDKQLAMYSLWVKQKYPDAKSVKLVWYFLAFDKEMISERSAEQLLKLKRETLHIIKEIEACNNFPTTTSPLCHYCVYKPICPAWRHEFALEEQQEEALDGKELADTYAQLDTEEKRISKEKEELKEKLISFAQKENITAIFGTDKKISITPFVSISYPKTEEFINLLKEKGVYEDVATINTQKLSSKVRKNELPEEVISQLSTEHGWSVRVGKRRD